MVQLVWLRLLLLLVPDTKQLAFQGCACVRAGMLNLVQAALEADGQAVLRIDGATSAKRRAQVC